MTRNTWLAAAAIVVVLVVAFAWGGSYGGAKEGGTSSSVADADMDPGVNDGLDPAWAGGEEGEPADQATQTKTADVTTPPSAAVEKEDPPQKKEQREAAQTVKGEEKSATATPAAQTKPAATATPVQTAATATPTPTAVNKTGDTGPAGAGLKDKYDTDPVPAGKPKPVEPQDVTVSDEEKTCTLSVTCQTILDNLDDLDPEKKELVPEDGVIFSPQEVTFYEGESVFNVLQREMKKNKIHMEFVNTPVFNSAYIEGIHNLYEFDCGDLSGWMYQVNGWFPNYGCSRYQLQDGDVIKWIYTCDLGRDIGGGFAASGGGE